MGIGRKVKPGAGRPRVYATDLPVYDTQEQCAGATGIPVDVLKKAKQMGCLFVRHGRVHLAEFIRWWFNRDMSDDDNEDWAKRDKRAVALIREVKLQEEYDRVVDFKIVADFVNALMNMFFAEHSRAEQEYPASLKGKTELEILEIVLANNNISRENLKKAAAEWLELKKKEAKSEDA